MEEKKGLDWKGTLSIGYTRGTESCSGIAPEATQGKLRRRSGRKIGREGLKRRRHRFRGTPGTPATPLQGDPDSLRSLTRVTACTRFLKACISTMAGREGGKQFDLNGVVLFGRICPRIIYKMSKLPSQCVVVLCLGAR